MARTKRDHRLLVYEVNSGLLSERGESDLSLVGYDDNSCIADSLLWRIQCEYAPTIHDVLSVGSGIVTRDDGYSACNDAFFNPTFPLFDNIHELVPFKCFYPVASHWKHYNYRGVQDTKRCLTCAC